MFDIKAIQTFFAKQEHKEMLVFVPYGIGLILAFTVFGKARPNSSYVKYAAFLLIFAIILLFVVDDKFDSIIHLAYISYSVYLAFLVFSGKKVELSWIDFGIKKAVAILKK